jgi:hypothetical protein
MNVYVYPSDVTGCGYYRLIWPSMVLQAQGHKVKLLHPSNTQRISGQTDGAGNLVTVNMPADADVMVFQRVTSKQMLNAIKIIRANGIAVVIDIDDDMSAIDQRNPAWVALHPKSGGNTAEYDWNTARKLAEAASYVTVSSDALLRRYAPHGRGMVLRNCVPEQALRLNPSKIPKSIGWGGAMMAHHDDPQVVGMSMAKIQREGYNFRIVGPQRGTREAFRLDREPSFSGAVPIANWPHELARLQVGIAPLNDTRFNAAKSWLKMLEYAACGVAAIGSPRAEYMRLHHLGVGLLASNPREWFSHAKKLLDNDTYREDIIAKSREAVAALTIESNAYRWMEAWSNALAVERGALGVKTGR